MYAGNDSRPQEPREGGETCHTFVALAECVAFPLVPTNYSSWLKLRRIKAWINRFVENCQKKRLGRISGGLMVDELMKAEIQLIKQTQCTEFQDEWKALAHRRPLPTSSKLLALKQKLDNDGLMRSDGRMKKC